MKLTETGQLHDQLMGYQIVMGYQFQSIFGGHDRPTWAPDDPGWWHLVRNGSVCDVIVDVFQDIDSVPVTGVQPTGPTVPG